MARSRLARDLESLGLEPGAVVMIHCRMSALGRVVGGAETVVRALFDAIGPEGTLMAYTGWQDEPPDDLDDLDEEKRKIYLSEHLAYDPRIALSRRDHGRVPGALAGRTTAGILRRALRPSATWPTCSPADTPTAPKLPTPGWSSSAAGWRCWGRRWTP